MITSFLRRTVEALDEAEVAHMVSGSVASTFHGEIRQTQDVDLVIESTAHPEALHRAFSAGFYTPPVDSIRTELTARGMFNVIDLESQWKADLIVCKDRPFSREEFRRRQPATLAGVDVHLVTVEDSILSKLEWALATGSDRQRRDIAGMLHSGHDRIDYGYLDRWAPDLGVQGLLLEIRSAVEAED